jgi:galactitol PTS system EIIB component
MEKIKTILVACGTAIATSTVVAISIQEALRERGIRVRTRQCKTAEVATHLEGIDLIVTTTALKGSFGIPIIQTVAFLTGIGKNKAIEDIVKILNG